MKTTHPTLRPYLETIEKHCKLLDRDSLVQLILDIAKQVEPGKRNNFLQTFHAELPQKEIQTASVSKTQLDELLADIEDLRQEILTRIQSIKDGSYWEDPDDEDEWQDSYYGHDDPDLINDVQGDCLADFFGEADSHFLHGNKEASHTIYNVLFSLINEAEEYSDFPDFNVDLLEARARLTRCVYELSPEEKRVDAMLVAMNADPQEDNFFRFRHRNLPLFRDVMDTDAENLPDLESFLTSWRTALGKHTFPNTRIADLLLEAALLQDGISAVSKLARDWQAKQPLGYLYWLQQLESEENWQELRDAAAEALIALPHGSDRREAAYFLVISGQKLSEDHTILTGYRERFNSKPGEASLLALVEEADRQQVRAKELDEIHTFLSQRKPEYGEEELLIKSLLMAGEVNQAFALCKKEKAVGWSSGGATGLLFASVLYLLCKGDNSCTLTKSVLEDYADSNTIYFNSYKDRSTAPSTSGFLEIVHGLDRVDTTSLDLDQYRQWSGTIGEKRVNEIVSNTHRSAYGSAAMVLGSLAETMAAAGNNNKAQALLHEYCKVLYNRHTAFKREVREAVGRSKILCSLGDGL